MTGDPRFHALLRRLGELHDRKQEDYGREGDPFANVRASEDFGIPGWIGCLVRMNDKMRRLMKAARGGTLANESVEDSFLDLAVYAIIGYILYRESLQENEADEQAKPELPAVLELREAMARVFSGTEVVYLDAQDDVEDLLYAAYQDSHLDDPGGHS